VITSLFAIHFKNHTNKPINHQTFNRIVTEVFSVTVQEKGGTNDLYSSKREAFVEVLRR